MNFEELLKLESPESFPDKTICWEFVVYNLKPPELQRQGDTGHYEHNETGCSKRWTFDNFEEFKEAYRVAHQENIRRLDKDKALLEVGPMKNYSWPPWQTGSDPCG